MFGVAGVPAQSFYSQTPETFKAMPQPVTVMEDLWPAPLLEKLADLIGRTIAAMRSDGIITTQSSAADIHAAPQEKVTRFFEAFASRVGRSGCRGSDLQ